MKKKIDFNKLLDKLDFWIAESDKWQDAFTDFNKVISPSSFMPILEDSYVQAFIEGVGIMDAHMIEELEYYAYDIKRMKEAVITYKGIGYDAKKRDEFVKYLELITQESTQK